MQKDHDLGKTLRLWATQVYSRFLRYARSKGFPYRRIRYLPRDFGRAAIFGLAFLAAMLLVTFLALWTAGEKAVFMSPQNQAQWFVEFLLIIFASVVLRFMLREKEPPAPSLICDGQGERELRGGGKAFGIQVKNNGDYAAIDCVARLAIEGIEELDILSGRRLPVFQGLDTGLNVELCWDLTSTKKKTLTSDDWGRLFIARWMPTNRREVEHFAIVGDKGWKSTSMKLATEPGHYFGKVKVTPLNGKAYYVPICLRKDALNHATMDLV